MQSALTPSADSAARDYYAREKYRSRLCLGGVSLGLAVLGCCAALLPGFSPPPVPWASPWSVPDCFALLCRPPAPVPRQGGQLPVRMRPLLVQQFYPGCGYCLLGSPGGSSAACGSLPMGSSPAGWGNTAAP